MRAPVLASLALHGLAVVFMAFTGADPKPPKETVYAVDIVSPPANVLGEPVPEPLANQEPGPAAPDPAPPATAEPEPAPEPEAAPPVPEKSAPKEPEKAPEPRKTPERPTPPRPTPTRPNPTPPRTTPSTPPRITTPNRQPATRPGSAQSGTGTAANRSRGEGTRTGPATGRNADAASPGGEGLTISSRGVRCPSAGYCENIVRQVRRFFRAPAAAADGSGKVCFRILRDGSVAEITTERVRGGAAFRLALMEAAEQAGNRKAFGALPAGFGVEELPVCVESTPNMP